MVSTVFSGVACPQRCPALSVLRSHSQTRGNGEGGRTGVSSWQARPWRSHLTSLSLSFLTCKIEGWDQVMYEVSSNAKSRRSKLGVRFVQSRHSFIFIPLCLHHNSETAPILQMKKLSPSEDARLPPFHPTQMAGSDLRTQTQAS